MKASGYFPEGCEFSADAPWNYDEAAEECEECGEIGHSEDECPCVDDDDSIDA